MNKRLTLLFILLITLVVMTACSSKEEKKLKFYEKGSTHYEAGELVKARLEFTNALQIDPEYADAYYMLGMAEMRLGNLKKAFGLLNKSVDLSPDLLDAHLQLGKFYLLGNNIEPAMQKADLILSKDPGQSAATLLKASVLIKKEQYGEAIQLLDQLRKNGAEDPQILLLTAVAHKQQGDFKSAERVIKTGIRQYTENTQFQKYLVRLYVDQNQLQAAISQQQELVNLEPQTIGHQIYLANLYWDTNDTAKVNGLLKGIIEKDPTNEANLLQISRFYRTKKENELAKQVINVGITAIENSYGLHFMLADLYLQEKDIQTAIQTLETCLGFSKDPADRGIIATKNKLAELYLAIKNIEKAQQYTDEVLADIPESVAGNYNKGRILLAKGDGVNAVSAFRMVVSERSNFLPGYLNLAKCHFLNREIDLAIDILMTALKVNPQAKDARRMLARAYAQKKDYLAAEKQIQKLLEQYPDDKDVLTDLGDLLMAAKDLKGAKETYQSIKAKSPEDAGTNYRLGQLYFREGKLEQSTREMQRAFKKDPRSNTIFLSLVQLHVLQKKHDLAISMCQNRLEQEPDNVLLYNVLGGVHMTRKAHDKAETVFKKAIEVQPRFLLSYNNLAKLYLITKEYQRGVQYFENAIQTNPENPVPYIALGGFYEAQQAYAEAMQVYERALSKNPKNFTAGNNLAFLLCENSDADADLDRALKLASTANDQQPDTAEILDTLAWVYYHKGELDQAETYLHSALALSPKNPVINFHMGMVLYKGGKLEQAGVNLGQSVAYPGPFQGKQEAEQVLAEIKAKM
jgi:tetratricopeptide (TPR) repeat protein